MKKKINKPANILSEEASSYGFAHKSEIEKLKENISRSDKEKLHLFTKMLRRNVILNKVVTTHKAH